MKTPLTDIQIASIYKVNKQNVLLPKRMARCTPDMHIAIKGIAAEVKNLGGRLILSDLFRSYEMQLQAHLDYTSKKKKAYSPPPGGSMHEAGRAMDIDVNAIKISLADFWEIAKKYGVVPIISKADKKISECWHFDCRGSHQTVYDYYKTLPQPNMAPYTAMAVSAILAIDVKVDSFAAKNTEAFIQSALIRLGYSPGPIDGNLGAKSKAALIKAGIETNIISEIKNILEDKLQLQFNEEFHTSFNDEFDDTKPAHIS
ncbi:MAG: D-alanyl-D-alanine carboxypeptidase family protein [Bacteroidales bacterium]|nr:D-alanyl-D-alanine carboxypeptidase family protein [Bacteroidales bacterium]